MLLLIIHHNFPGQYLHLARHMGAQAAHRVLFLTQVPGAEIPGVTQIVYSCAASPAASCHPYNQVHESGVQTGLAVLAACRRLAAQGLVPDLIIGHAGWGEMLLLKLVFPHVPVLAYFEYFYRAQGADIGYDAEFAPERPGDVERLYLRNSITLLSLAACDAGHTATPWQRSLFPAASQARIEVLHEGVDTAEVRPDPAARFTLPDGRVLSRDDEVITYVARSLEPYRGFHCLMRALPAVLAARPQAQVLIAGSNEVSYGDLPPYGGSWRELLLGELGPRLDLSRIHFLGTLVREDFLRLLQVSRLHVYFTYPFVLSWSCIEAMAAGCLLLGSDVAPVRDVLRDGVNSLLVDMRDRDAVAARMIDALQHHAALDGLRARARADSVAGFDLASRCLPRWMSALEALAARPHAAASRDR